MGKIVLILIAVGMAYGVATIWSKWSERTASMERGKPPVAVTEKAEGQDSGQPIKTAPVASSAQVSEPEPEIEPLAVGAATRDYLLIEGWGFVRKGDELEDGSIVEEWNHRRVVVRTERGKETRRIRRPLEALAELASAVAVSAPTMPGSQDRDEKTDP
jgi:hypothetical protein